MITVLSQPYLSLDPYLDMKTFDSIVDDIIISVARSLYAQGPTQTGGGYLDKSMKSVHEIYRDITFDSSHPYHDTIKNLKNWEPYHFIKYKWPSHTLGQCLILRETLNNSYFDKGDHTKCKDHAIKANFGVFFSWLDQQGIFESIGRAIVFLNERNTSVLEHRDYHDGKSRKDHFIWISPLGNKSFYVRDDNEKAYVNSRVCYFDNANIHGSDVLPDPTFSIRIDGNFSQDFIKRVGLEEHLYDQ